MAIPNNYIDKLTDNDNGESRLICPPAEQVRVENENFEADNLDDVLDELAEGLGEAGQVNEIIMNGQHYTPTNKVIDLGTVITQHQDISGKADKATTYTNTETDNAIANAVEGLGGGSVESVSVNGGQPVQPDQNGNVHLEIEGGEGKSAYQSYLETTTDNPKKTEAEWVASLKGPKGDTGNVVVSDGVAQIGIINDLETGGEGDALSARQGLVLRQAVNTVQANLQAVLSALANMAFSDSKPTLTPIDWTGGTFYATVNYGTMTGVTHTDDSINGQVEEHETLTVLLTALSGYTLTGATISVTNSKGQAVAYLLDGSTLTIADVVGSITISVVAKAVYSVANNDTHATLSNSTPANPTHGGSWSGTLTADNGYSLLASPDVTMGGVSVDFSASGNSWNNSTGAMTIGNVTGDIVIVSVSEEHIVHNITNRLLNMSSSNSGTSVEPGDSYSTQLAADNGCTANGDVRVKIGNSYAFNEYDVSQGSENNSGITYENGLLTIPAAAITGDIEIIATAYTGVVKITTTGATTLKYNGGTTFNLVEGLNEVAFPDGEKWFNVGDKTLVTSIDFGGLMFTGTYERTLAGYTNLTSVQNLVVGGGANSISGWFNNTSSLSAVDISLWDVSKVTSIARLFTGSAIQRVDMSMLVFENAVSLSATFQNTTSLTYIDIRTIENVSNVDRMFSYASGTAPQCNVYIGDFNASSISTATNVFLFGNVNLHCLSSTPPLIGNTNWLTSGGGPTHIYVPDEAAVTAYSGATGWSAKASIIAVEPTNN